MFKLFKKVVTGPKRTTNYEGIQLDLTYISQRIIAMAFPASDLIEKTYRNNIEDVAAYLAETHNQKYLIINVSSRIYDYELFRMKVKDFEWPDHQAPALSALVGVAYSIYDFLQQDEASVVAVHCNHGKGRTGTAIITFFLLIKYAQSANECLKFYNSKRFNKQTYGVDQPCQLRYLYFIQKLMQASYIEKKLACYNLKLVTHKGLSEGYFLRIKSTRTQQIIYDRVYFDIPLDQHPFKFLIADIFIELFLQNWMGEKRVARINYNLFFLDTSLSLKFTGHSIKVESHGKDFELQFFFEYHCLCHFPNYSHTICNCNYTRNIEELQWAKMASYIAGCKKLAPEAIQALVHGGEEKQKMAIKYVQSLQKLERNGKIFRNRREQKLFVKSQNCKFRMEMEKNEKSEVFVQQKIFTEQSIS